MSAPRLLMIGLDAFDRGVLEAHAAALPNIARLVREGHDGELAAEPMAGAVWPSFYTRSPAAGHGVYHHLQWDPAGMRIRRTSGDWLSPQPFWRELGARGVKVVAFDVPFVFPAAAPTPNVLEVMNWGSHDLVGPFWASDRGVERGVRQRFGRHPMGFEVPVRKSRAHLERLLGDIVRGAALKGQVAAALMREVPWDLFIVAFGEAHRGGHMMWPNPEDSDDPSPRDAILRIYQAVDEAVGAVLAAAGPAVEAIVFALHGMGPNSSQSHLTSAFMQRVCARFRDEPAPAEQGEAPGLVRALRRSVPPGLQFAVAAAAPQAVRDYVVAREIGGGYRWDRTPGFCLHGDLAGYLRLNIRGRERDGLLGPAEASSLLELIAAELHGLTLPDGRKVVRQVHFPSGQGGGPRAHLLPDVVVEWDPQIAPARELRSSSLGRIRAASMTGRGGNHRFNGFYAYRGARSPPGPGPRRIAELADLAQALLQP